MGRFWSLAAAGFVLLFGGTALADDPPDRVGRLSYIEGSVSVRGADDDQWVPAQLNLPVTTGTAVWTQPGGRAEIQVGAATIRVDQDTELQVTRLDDHATELAVPQGAVNVHVPAGQEIEPIWIATPTGLITLAEPGFYRVADGRVTPVGANPTPFDQWAMGRERQLTAAQAETLRYVSPQVTGYQDLAGYGQWTVTPDYGAVWYPTAVSVGWVPYRYGHWAYIAPWGWTWVDAAPWGFAPFHYGRWVRVHGRWAWWPGRIVARPVYAPALVIFIGEVHSRSHRPSRWVPLAPYEAFHPHYRATEVHVRNVNRTTVRHTEINNITVVNSNVGVERLTNRNAASSLPRSDFDRDRSRRSERSARPDGRPNRDDARPLIAPQTGTASTAAPQAGSPRTGSRTQAPDILRRDRFDDRRNRLESRTVAPSGTTNVVTPQAAPTPSAAPQAESPRAAPRREASPDGRRNRPDRQPGAPESRIAPPVTTQAEPSRAVSRPEAPAVWRRNRPEDHRNPPEARVAPPTSTEAVRPYLATPSAPRQAARPEVERSARTEPSQAIVPNRVEPLRENSRRETPSPRMSAPTPQPQVIAPRREVAPAMQHRPVQAPPAQVQRPSAPEAHARPAPAQPARVQAAPQQQREQNRNEHNPKKRDDQPKG